MEPTPFQTPPPEGPPDERPVEAVLDEERVNAATHAVGLAFGVGGAAVLLWVAFTRGAVWQMWGCAIYAATLVAVYAASTLSHVFRRPRPRHVLRVADQATIFLFIAGTYTPIALAWLREGPWWIFHALVWGIALAGFASKAIFAHRVRPDAVSTVLYVVLGWMPVLAAGPMLAAVPGGLAAWVLAGGLCYMAGTVFFRYDDRIRYFHAAWHVLVLAGSVCHYLGILMYCTSGV